MQEVGFKPMIFAGGLRAHQYAPVRTLKRLNDIDGIAARLDALEDAIRDVAQPEGVGAKSSEEVAGCSVENVQTALVRRSVGKLPA